MPTTITPGSFKVQAALNDNPNGSGLGGTKATATINVVKAEQFITLGPIPAHKFFGDPAVTLTGTASSGLAVQFSVNGPATLSANNSVTITGTGVITITASQPGDDRFNPAPSITRLLEVFKANQSLTVSPIQNKTYGDPPFNAQASASSGLPVRIQISSGPAVLAQDGKIQLTGAGFVTIVVSQDGNENFHAASAVFQSFNVTKATLTVTVNDASRSFGAPNPTFTGTLTGAQNQDNITATFETSATQTSPVGAYAILPRFHDAAGRLGNYALNVTRGTLTVTANVAPVAQPQSVTTDEDTPKAITLTGTDAEGVALTFVILQGPQHGFLSGAPPTVTYTPNLNFNGSAADTLSFKVNDGLQDSAPGTVTITINPVNDPPTLSPIPNIGLRSSGPVMAIPLSGITAGPPDEPQTLTITASSSDTSKVTVQGVDYTSPQTTGAVRLQAVANATGSATITVTVSDGAAANATTTRTFTAVITPRVIRVVNTTGLAGGLVAVPVEFVAQGDENSLGFSANFDNGKLTFENAALGNDATAASLSVDEHDAGNGRVGLNLTLPANQVFAAGNKQIARLTFRIPVAVAEGDTQIVFARGPISLRAMDGQGNPLPIAFDGGTVSVAHGYEADVTPRPFGSNDGTVTVADWTRVGLLALQLDRTESQSEFQRADCAPRQIGSELALGDGVIGIADWVQAGRYAAGLDAPVPKAGGPSAPSQSLLGNASGPSSLARKSLAAKPAARSLKIQNRVVSEGQSFLAWVELNAQGDENALGFSLRYDTEALSFVAARPAKGIAGVTLLTNLKNIEAGRLGLALALPTGLTFQTGLRTLVELEFKALTSTAFSRSRLQFADDPVRREIVEASARPLDASYFDGTIVIESAAGIAAESLRTPKLQVIGRSPEGDVLLGLKGESSKQYLIETSEDLRTWRPLKSIWVTGGGIEIVDGEARGLPGRYYRVRPAE
ncbi:MAG: cadherin-like domain-containing protein [Verrucomicrobia bacterium]|nr:cadherin-like domain-containing protein [Verrucomicrobiota bacterium]